MLKIRTDIAIVIFQHVLGALIASPERRKVPLAEPADFVLHRLYPVIHTGSGNTMALQMRTATGLVTFYNNPEPHESRNVVWVEVSEQVSQDDILIAGETMQKVCDCMRDQVLGTGEFSHEEVPKQDSDAKMAMQPIEINPKFSYGTEIKIDPGYTGSSYIVSMDQAIKETRQQIQRGRFVYSHKGKSPKRGWPGRYGLVPRNFGESWL
jgi:hypothetical protein